MQRATIIDVARHAGVSWKTVSRVVNGEAGVRPATADKVRAAVAALGYRPNAAARSLVSDRSFLIGMMLPEITAHYVVALHKGAAERCRERGYQLVMEVPSQQFDDFFAGMERVLMSVPYHGIILMPPLCNMPEPLEMVERLGTQAVLIDPLDRTTPWPFVAVDDAPGVEALVDHAVALGHRRFGLVEGSAGHHSSTVRADTFRSAVARHSDIPILAESGDFRFASGFAAGEALLANETPPTFIFAINDDMAAGVIAAARRRGLDIPGQVSVAGFDDIATASVIWPPLTTIRQPIEAIGASAIDLLTAPPGDRPDEPPTFGVELVIRESTGPVPPGG